MVDPKYATNYNRTTNELQEFAIFSVCVAGKNAHNTARAVAKLLEVIKFARRIEEPLYGLYDLVKSTSLHTLQLHMKVCGIGCHTGFGTMPGRAEVCYNLSEKIVKDNTFLSTCTVEDLESIKGIGSKTARFFLLHTRPGLRIAALDTHILKFLNDRGIKAPKTTPPKGSKKYKELEEKFLSLCDSEAMDYAEMDLQIWNNYSLDGLGNSGRIRKTRRTNAKDSTES